MNSRLGVVVGVLAVVLAIVAIVGPWWTVDSSIRFGGLTGTGHIEYNMFGRTEATQSNISSSSNSTSYANLPQTGGVFTLASVLVILGIIMGIGMVIIGAMSGANPSLRRFAAIAGVLAFLVLLVAALYVMSALPGAVNQDGSGRPGSTAFSGFWGSTSSSFLGISATVNWAAGWAWYVALVAAIVFLAGAIMIIAARKPAMPATLPPPAP